MTPFLRTLAFPLLLAGILAAGTITASGAEPPGPPPDSGSVTAFHPGERLTYDVSWSRVVKAGNATMEVKTEQLADGREVLRFVVHSRTEGVLGRIYPLGDTMESVFDPVVMQSLSYRLSAHHGKRTRNVELSFDPLHRTVVTRLNSDPPRTDTVPEHVLDPLSALYVLRTRKEFTPDRPVSLEVFDGTRTTSIEVRTVGREKVKTPAGEFETIRIRAYKGLFLSDGEVNIWVTDDERKVPVLIKSKIAIGSVVFSLRELRP